MNPIKKALIVANTRKQNIQPIIDFVKSNLQKRDIECGVISPAYFKLDTGYLLTELDNNYKHQNYDIILALGGDGTFLYTARTFINFSIPIIGINAGRVGFLMEVTPNEISEALDKICSQQIKLEERMLLEATVIRNGISKFTLPFLNDAVISKGTLSRMIEIAIFLDQEELSQYRADGLIVSTPTGSTAYNLAAGGPILTPDMQAMIISPICPHILGVRPIVTQSLKELEIQMISNEADTTLTIDGQENIYLQKGDSVKIKAYHKSITIFDYGEKQFFSVLREKLGWHI